MRDKVVVAVAGGFDPFRSGHLHHFQKAKELGDILVVLVSNDTDMIHKKGYCLLPIEERIELLRNQKGVDHVVQTLDIDGTQAKTLEYIHPDIFAKGGDRTPANMPANEIEACERLGIKIMYGVGDLETSSSDCVRKAIAQLYQIRVTRVTCTKCGGVREIAHEGEYPLTIQCPLCHSYALKEEQLK